ncbi:hypothetical protein EGW08_004138 [Elysia chlorotica]|uniref:Bardet-Biedl syndrome 10 protein n=1 Tax=Elysia chlorotica TaxID=188477 RepID=A0A3S1BNY1_ELYCH|nr:hypothetical protein EGW08_004138 [Elysia chlorotica]
MTCPSSALGLTDLVNVSSVLRNIVQPSFGPICRPTLITSNTGQVVFTKDGHMILASLSLSHPVTKIILESIEVQSQLYGDGCKTLILYLSEIFLGIQRNLHVWNTDYRMAQKNSISSSLQKYIMEDFASMYQNLTESVSDLMFPAAGGNSCSKMARQVARTILSGHLPEDLVDHLGNLISDFIITLSRSADQRTILDMCFQNCVHVFPSGAYLSSRLMDGLFFTGAAHPCWMKRVGTTQFVIALCPLDGEEQGSHSEYFFTLKSHKTQEDIMHYKIQTVNVFLKSLRNHGVSLLVTSAKVSDFVLSACDSLGVDVFSCVDQEDIEFISFYTGMSPITSVHEEITDTSVCKVYSYSQTVHSGKQMLSLVCPGKSPDWQAKSIFLYAPSEGLVEQLKLLVRKCFRVMSHLLGASSNHTVTWTDSLGCFSLVKTRPEEMLRESLCRNYDVGSNMASQNVIPGGGYFEFFLCYLIEKNTGKTSTEKKTWADILRRMLLSVPQTLFHNLHPNGENQTLSFVHASQVAKKLLQDNKIVGFDSHGKLHDVIASGVVDVLSVKTAALFTALDLAVTLLRTDSILSVRKLPEQGV